jgi:hypothetical protein
VFVFKYLCNVNSDVLLIGYIHTHITLCWSHIRRRSFIFLDNVEIFVVLCVSHAVYTSSMTWCFVTYFFSRPDPTRSSSNKSCKVLTAWALSLRAVNATNHAEGEKTSAGRFCAHARMEW